MPTHEYIIEKQPITFSNASKLIGIVVAVVTICVATTATIYRSQDVRIDNHEIRLTGDETRICTLELRQRENEKMISEINTKLDVTIVILNRIDKSIVGGQ